MYNLSFKDAIKLTGKTKRTIQRYLSSGKLTYVDSPNGSKLFNRLELLQTVGVVAPTGNSDFLALAKEQLAATQLNNELLSEVLRTLKSEHQQQLEAPDPTPEKLAKDKDNV